ncbi:hemicentin-1-like [Epinephelus lanceolatus]
MYQYQPLDLTTDPQYSGRVQYDCDKIRNNCTLRITDLRESDSAQYKFRFTTSQPNAYTGSPGVTLSVTGLQVSRYSYGLKCQSSCVPDRPSFIWYKNGQKIQAEASSSYYYLGNYNYKDSYSCAVKGYDDFPSPPTCADVQTCNRVTYTDRNICAFKGSSVDISCTYSSYKNHVESKFWFSPERKDQWQNPSQPEDLSKDSQFAGRVQVIDTERGRSTLRITDLRESDSAEYHFKFTTPSFEWRSSLPGTTLTVTALQVQVTRITVGQSVTEAELKCHSSCSPAGRLSYVWFNNKVKITGVETSSYKARFGLSDNVSCAIKGLKEFPSPSVYAPKLPSVSVSPSAEIVEGSSVTLTCSSDANPAAKYTWYKKTVNPRPLSEGPQLVFSSIQSSDSGQYYCTAENKLGRRTSNDFTMDVKYAPRVPSVSVNPSGKIMEGSSVTLTCSSDANPAAKKTWYMENQKVLQGSDGVYQFMSISSEDRGKYYCTSENQHGRINSSSIFIDVQYAPKLPSVSVSPSAEIVEGSSVNLTCSSDANPAAKYTWYKEDEDSPKASGQIFTITDVRAEHSGNYYCEAKNSRGRHNSTFNPIIVSRSMKSVAAGSITAIFLAIIFVLAFLFIRRKRSWKQTPEPRQRPDDNAQANMGAVYDIPPAPRQTTPSEQQDDLCYASVSFSKNQEDPLYSNVRPNQPNRHREEEEDEDDVEYSVVNFKSAGAATDSSVVIVKHLIQGQNGWGVTYTSTKICAVKGSTVEIHCRYTYPSRIYGCQITVEKTFWFANMYPYNLVDLTTDPQYSGRVQYDCDKIRNYCTLRITDLRESDAAEYKFMFITNHPSVYTGSPGVTLSVTGLQVSRYSYGLKCQSSCVPDRPSFIWYKNGQKIQTEASSSYYYYYLRNYNYEDSYSCAVKGYDDSPSPPTCADGETCNRVTYTDRNICASKGSSVDISCTYSSYKNHVESKFWFSPERKDQWGYPIQPADLSKDSQFAGRVQVIDTERRRSTLRITDLRESDSAEYHFKFTAPSFEWRSSLPGTTLTVTALQVQVTRITVGQSVTEAELKCHSSCSPAGRLSYVWFNNKVEILWEYTSSYKARFGLSDNVSCAIRGHEEFPSPSVYAPKLPSVSVSPSAEIVEGSSVTLTCSSDANPAANYTWYKETVNPRPLSEGPQLVFSSIQSSDSGQYYCTAENELGRRTSNDFTMNVKYAPRVPSVSVNPSGKIMEGSSVTLTCSSDANPAAKKTWYMENQKVLQGSDGVYQFMSISSEDRGKYYCTSENQHGRINSSSIFIDVQYAPKLPSVSVSPSAEIVEGSSVTLTCSSDANPAAKYTWYKKTVDPRPLSEGPQLVSSSIQSSDSGQYYCTAENELGRRTSNDFTMDVKYAPKLPSVSVSPSAEIVEGSSVNLTCSSDANPAAKYTWYKEDEDSPKASGQIFTITDIRAEHSGNYYCEAQNSRGRHNSTFSPIIVSRSMKSVAAGSITAIFLAIIFVLAFLFIRRKRSWKQTPEPRQRPDDNAQANVGAVYDIPPAPRQTTPSEQQDDLCYASVSFSKNQEDPLYSNVRLNQPNRHREEEEDADDVEYSVVNFKSAGAATESIQEEPAEDSSVLYSTVLKKPRV